MVILPTAIAGWYLWVRAADQYASYVGFSVRKEETSSAVELLGGITELSGSSSTDTDILYKFLQSQEIVRRIDTKLDLRKIWSKGNPRQDPVFAYHPSSLFNYAPPGTIEDLTDHWLRKVKVYYDEGSGLIDLRVLAFAPEDAQAIAEEIFDESSRMINELSDIAREDAMRYARDELEEAVVRLKDRRRTMTEFRNNNRIVDPEASIQGQVGLITTLQNELATALIELDMLKGTAQSNDPRVQQTQRRINVIENRIDQERRKFGNGSAPSAEESEEAYAELLGTYETLVVDRQFAEESYRLALSAYDAAQAEARRQSRYLAAHITPTLAEKSKFPDRTLLLGIIAIFSVLLWATIVLIGYSLKDRR
jgi:capsular polysaccharide transport system permease protein